MTTKDERKAKYDAEHPAPPKTRVVIRLALLPLQYAELEALMLEDTQVNKTAFIVYLIAQEKKRREEDKRKRGVGRPKGSTEDDGDDETELAIYPHPAPFGPNKDRLLTRSELDFYNEHHGQHL